MSLILVAACHLCVAPTLAENDTTKADTLAARRATGQIVGEVRDSASNTPRASVTVRLDGSRVTMTDSSGRFEFTQVEAGTHAVQVTRIGMQPVGRRNIVVAPPAAAHVTILAVPAIVKLASVVVTPSSFGMLSDVSSTSRGLSREQLESRPQLGDDIYRTMNRLPGVASTDVSAQLHVRGSDYNELLVCLDGAQLYEPFHLKDIDGALSIVDANIINSVDVSTGGFGAQYGDRLTGVFDLRTSDQAPAESKTSLGLSASSVHALSNGSFANGDGQWMVSARRGYMDLALRLAGDPWPAKPRYGDVFAKVEQRFGTQAVAVHGLYASDAFSYNEAPGYIVNSGYGDGYGWLTWSGAVGSRLTQQTVVSGARLSQQRAGTDTRTVGRAPVLTVADDRGFTAFGLSQNWLATITDWLLIKAGFEVRQLSATYAYDRTTSLRQLNPTWSAADFDTVNIATAPSGSAMGAYLSQRIRVNDRLTLETGLRTDRHSYLTNDGAESRPSPRLGAAFSLNDQTTLRAAWGRYTQAQLPNEIDVADGIRDFSPVQVAEHRILGLERRLMGGLVRVEAYRRATSNVLPRAENLGGEVVMIPEAEPDRRVVMPSASLARGVEVFASHQSAKVDWSGSYVLASTQDLVDGRWTPRPLDQRHTIVTDVTIRPTSSIALSAAWQFHTGWPSANPIYAAESTGVAGAEVANVVTDGIGTQRVAPYHRLDVRVTKTFQLAHGGLSAFVDVFNVYDHANPAGYTYVPQVSPSGALTVDRTQISLLPRLPSVGITWQF